jgi:hypothetical protein
VRLTPEPASLAGLACLVIIAGRGLTFGDFRSHDLFGFGLGEAAPFCLPGAETSYGTGEMRAAGTSGRRRPGGDGAGVVDRGQGRAQRRGRGRVRARSASRSASCRRWRVPVSATRKPYGQPAWPGGKLGG